MTEKDKKKNDFCDRDSVYIDNQINSNVQAQPVICEEDNYDMFGGS